MAISWLSIELNMLAFAELFGARLTYAEESRMEFAGHFRRLTPVQRNTFTACFLGWSLDAFDFFILTFCVSAIATQFHDQNFGGHRSHFHYASLSSRRRISFRADGRPLRTPRHPHGRHHRLLGIRVGIGIRSFVEGISDYAGFIRNCHGRRMGRGRGLGIRDACPPRGVDSSPDCYRKATPWVI